MYDRKYDDHHMDHLSRARVETIALLATEKLNHEDEESNIVLVQGLNEVHGERYGVKFVLEGAYFKDKWFEHAIVLVIPLRV